MMYHIIAVSSKDIRHVLHGNLLDAGAINMCLTRFLLSWIQMPDSCIAKKYFLKSLDSTRSINEYMLILYKQVKIRPNTETKSVNNLKFIDRHKLTV